MLLKSEFSCYGEGSLLSPHHRLSFPQEMWIGTEQHDFLRPTLAACFCTVSRYQRCLETPPFVIYQDAEYIGSCGCRSQGEDTAEEIAKSKYWPETSPKRAAFEAMERNALNWLAFPPWSKTYWNLHAVNPGSGAVKCHLLEKRTWNALCTIQE